jgi:hypothetical protein
MIRFVIWLMHILYIIFVILKNSIVTSPRAQPAFTTVRNRVNFKV